MSFDTQPFRPGVWPNHPNEEHRLELLKRFEVLDTEFENSFDRVTQLGSKMFNVPICLVTLVDTDRQWFKSCIGLGVRETGRDSAFCAHAILPNAPSVFLVLDTLKDARFANNPLVVGDPSRPRQAGQCTQVSDR